MSLDPRTPVVVGVGQIVRRDEDSLESCEPVVMMAAALRSAAADSGAERLLRDADSVRCVPTISWPYSNVAASLAGELGLAPRETVLSGAVGGDGPQRLMNDTCAEIAAGRVDVALLAGAEALAAMRAAERAGGRPPWPARTDGEVPTRTLAAERQPVNAAELEAGLAPPVLMYALIESAIRASSGADKPSHLRRISSLWSRFSEVAADNPCAWIPRSLSAAEIATPTPENRAVASPYTKLLTANMQVNLASGLIVTSVQAAERAGVPKDRWVFVHSGAQAEDEWHVSERRELAASPAIRAVVAAALAHAGIGAGDLSEIDLYSCFPAAVQIGAAEIGLAIDDPARPLTATGGLTFAGGPGNNYSGHGIAALVQRLRENPDAYGLATALGWYLTKHAAGIYSTRPPQAPYASIDAKPAHPAPRRSLTDYSGPATVEAYTLAYERDGQPLAAIVSVLTSSGERAIVRSAESDVLAAVLDDDPLGWPAAVAGKQQLVLNP